MSEETELRSKREIEADIALKEAEARKMEADAKNVEAMIRKNELEADKMTIELTCKQMDLVVKEEKRAKEKATDEENFLYRFGTEVGGKSVNSCMKKLTEWHRINPKCDIELVFSSPGGSIIDGFELFDFLQHLRNEGHHITTGTLGYAASMAGILLQAGDTRWIGQQAWMMIHRAAFGAYVRRLKLKMKSNS